MGYFVAHLGLNWIRLRGVLTVLGVLSKVLNTVPVSTGTYHRSNTGYCPGFSATSITYIIKQIIFHTPN